jgi:hypothetical protein
LGTEAGHFAEGPRSAHCRTEARSGAAEVIEDARDLLFKLSNREAIVDAALAWIRSTTVLGYHGTRLTEGEIASVQTVGLLPLKAQARRDRLIRALSPHPRWSEVANGLDAAIEAHGPGNCSGWREGQVHLTLSRAGLVNSFNHYLTHGAEFDQHVAYALLGTEGERLLGLDGKPRIIQIAVPGDFALDASHPHFGIGDLRAKGDVPNLVGSFLDAWSYRLAHPKFQARTLKVDSGMVFRSTVPATWVMDIETLPEGWHSIERCRRSVGSWIGSLGLARLVVEARRAGKKKGRR